MTRSQIFTAAHKLAKTYTGNYSACFALALTEVYASLKNVPTCKFPTFKEYGREDRAEKALAAILEGGKFNGIVYAKNHQNGKVADLAVYVSGTCYALGRIQLGDVAACKAEFLAAVQTPTSKTAKNEFGSETEFGTWNWWASGMNAE